MARSFDSDTQAMLDAYRTAARNLIRFDFGADGIHTFWSGAGTLTHNGEEYIGVSSLFEIEPADETVGLEANAIKVAMRAVPEAGLTTDVLANIEDYAYKQAEVTISTAYFDPDDHTLVAVETAFNGFVDQIIHDEDGQGGYRLVGRIESRSRDHIRTGYRRRSHEDHKRIKSDDGGLKHAAKVGLQRIFWGRKGPKPARTSSAATSSTRSSSGGGYFSRFHGRG